MWVFRTERERKKHSKLFFFLKISKTGKRSSVRRKNSSIGNYFIKCEKGFYLQSYLHATSRAMRAEQAASTETLVQGSSRHSRVSVEVPEPFPGAPFPSWTACWQESPQKYLQGKGCFFFSPDTIFYPKSNQCTNEAAERHALVCSGEYLSFLTPQGVHCCLAFVFFHIFKDFLFNILFQWFKEKMLQ